LSGHGWYVSVSAGAYLRQTQSGPTQLAHRDAPRTARSATASAVTVSPFPVLTLPGLLEPPPAQLPGLSSGTAVAPGAQSEAFDPGLLAMLAVGMHPLPDLLPGLRTELEFGYTSYSAAYVAPTAAAIAAFDGRHYNATSGGTFERETATVNVFYDVPLGTLLTPYVGGGFGYAHSSGGPGLFTSSEGAVFRTTGASGGSRNGGVGIAEVRVAVNLGEGWSVVPAYRYMRMVGAPDHYGEEAAQVIKLGLRRTF
jgi:hypothetical protein